MAYNDDVIQALAWLRNGAVRRQMDTEAFNTLDNAGVFQEIDEQTAYGESVGGSQGVVASVTAARVPKEGVNHPAARRRHGRGEYHY